MSNKERRALQQRIKCLRSKAEREPSSIMRGWYLQRAKEAAADLEV